jgi:hypothetical protein
VFRILPKGLILFWWSSGCVTRLRVHLITKSLGLSCRSIHIQKHLFWSCNEQDPIGVIDFSHALDALPKHGPRVPISIVKGVNQ